MAVLNSRSAPTKFVPLSEPSSWTWLRLAMKHLSAFMKECVFVKWRCYLNMDCSYDQAGKNDATSLHNTPPALHLKRSKIIYSDMSKRRFIWSNSFRRQICWHLKCLFCTEMVPHFWYKTFFFPAPQRSPTWLTLIIHLGIATRKHKTPAFLVAHSLSLTLGKPWTNQCSHLLCFVAESNTHHTHFHPPTHCWHHWFCSISHTPLLTIIMDTLC